MRDGGREYCGPVAVVDLRVYAGDFRQGSRNCVSSCSSVKQGSKPCSSRDSNLESLSEPLASTLSAQVGPYRRYNMHVESDEVHIYLSFKRISCTY